MPPQHVASAPLLGANGALGSKLAKISLENDPTCLLFQKGAIEAHNWIHKQLHRYAKRLFIIKVGFNATGVHSRYHKRPNNAILWPFLKI